VIDRMERLGLLAPQGDVDKVLETVVNNIEVTNNLNIDPEIRCRVLMTSTLESFTIGHTIVMSRGLIDVLPDEASLATMLAHEMAHVVLGHRIAQQFAFFDRMLFDEKDTFRHFGFARTPEEEQAANAKGAELLRNSPYKTSSARRRSSCSTAKPRQGNSNLISPTWATAFHRLGARRPTAPGASQLPASATTPQGQATIIAHFPRRAASSSIRGPTVGDA